MTINESTKEALMEAMNKDVPYVAAFIEDGIATTYSSGSTTSDVLNAIAHLLLQIVVHNLEDDPTEEELTELILYALEYIQEHTLILLDDMMHFSDMAN
jgi:hypothetical protein